MSSRTPENAYELSNAGLSLVGLPDVTILDVEDVPGAALRVHVELTRSVQAVLRAGWSPT
jgi:hypothetical protein